MDDFRKCNFCQHYDEYEGCEKFIEDGLNNPDKDKAFGHDAIEIMTEVHYMQAAAQFPRAAHKVD